ncbi:MAG: hypothetical protein IPJ71_16100 [Bdellovibrionales bacterium]|nr:hypothetical protein [Bdellovibrionales bacterium]
MKVYLIFPLMKNVLLASLIFCSLVAHATSGTEGGGINEGSKQGSSSQNMGTIINLAAGGTLAAICATEGGAWACPMAAMAFLQAATQAAAAGDSNNVTDATNYKPPTDTGGGSGGGGGGNGDGSGGGGSGGGGDGGGGGGGFESGGNPIIDNNLRELEKNGYKVNPTAGTVTTPKGVFPTSAFSSADSMAAAGMDPSQVAAARKGLEALNKELAEKYGEGPSVVAMGVGGAGGGGSGVESGEGGAANGSDPMAAYLASLKNKLNQKRDPASVAGMQKMLGGEPIGVKMDNIFEMIHRRYQKKRKANVFIE